MESAHEIHLLGKLSYAKANGTSDLCYGPEALWSGRGASEIPPGHKTNPKCRFIVRTMTFLRDPPPWG